MDRQTLYFTMANVRQCLNEEQKMAIYYKSLFKIAAPEGYWRLPSSPITKKHMCIFYVVVVAVVVVVVVAVDDADDVSEDVSEACQRTMMMMLMMMEEKEKEKDMQREKSNNHNLKGGEKLLV